MSGLDRLIVAGLIPPRSPKPPVSPARTAVVTIALARRAVDLLPPGSWADWCSGRNPPVPFSKVPKALNGWFRETVVAHPERDGRCPICFQPRYAGGAWWRGAGENRRNAMWHAPCVDAWKRWTSGAGLWRFLAERQGWVCAETGKPLREPAGYLLRTPEVDHKVPLWRVRAEATQHQWPDVLRFWDIGNLQALSPEGHRLKTAREAAERAAIRRAAA